MQLPEILSSLTELATPDQPLYLVGGAVRDFLLEKPCKDYDLVGVGDVRGIARRFANLADGKFFVLDEERNTCRVLIDLPTGEREMIDFSVMRGATILDDLAERDFSINAMAVDLLNPDTIIDPFKGGRDLQEKWLRPVRPDSLRNDPLRTIRAVRYAVNLGLKIEPSTADQINKAVLLLNGVSTERKRDELFKILSGEKIHVALYLFSRFGILDSLPIRICANFHESVDLSRVLGEMLHAITTNDPGQKKAAFFVTSLMLMFGQFRTMLRNHYFHVNTSGRNRKALLHLCVLLDPSSDYSKKKILENLALSVEEATMIDDHMRNREFCAQLLAGGPPTPVEIYRFFRETGSTGVDLILSSLASYCAGVGAELQQEEWLKRLMNAGHLVEAWYRKPEVVRPRPFLNGDEIMLELHLSPGPQVGDLLETLICEQVDGKVNTRADAIRWLKTKVR